ncbi:glycosyltransferase family 4 protein [Bacillus salacetis]|nr:glycosyltransferase family 4 protein [Bacillus salacetis]
MRILLATVYPLPGGGGIWSFVSNLKEKLERKGHEVDILSTNKENTKAKILNTTISANFSSYEENVAHVLQTEQPGLPPGSFMYFWERQQHLFQSAVSEFSLEKYDIIHAQDITAALSLSRIKPPRVPLVTSVNGYLAGEIFYVWKSRYLYKTDEQLWSTPELQYCHEIEKQGCHASDRLHAASNWLTALLQGKYAVPSGKIHTFRYGIDIEKMQKGVQKAPVRKAADKKIILCMGRLVYLKGIHYLIEALFLLSKERKDWECWILGEGDMEDVLKEKCRTRGLTENVKFKGFIKDVGPVLRQADILVHPSLQETLPHTVIEAQVSGVPVIVSDAAAMPEMVKDGETGLVFPQGDSEALAQRISSLLKDSGKREALRDKALKWGKQYWDSAGMIENMEKLYLAAINEKQGG